MISEASIVGMLLDSHYLNTVVSIGSDAWQDLFAEFSVASHLLLLSSHTDVAFIDEQRVDLRTECLMLEFVGSPRCPHLCTEDFVYWVLYHPACTGGDALSLASFPANFQFVEVAMFDGISGKFQFPIHHVFPAQLVLRMFFPVIEVSNQVDFRSIGCPFSENPSILCAMQSKIEVSVCHVRQQHFSIIGQFLQLVLYELMPTIDGFFVRGQPRVILDECQLSIHDSCVG